MTGVNILEKNDRVIRWVDGPYFEHVPDSNEGWPNVGPTSVLSSRRWANVSPTYIAVWGIFQLANATGCCGRLEAVFGNGIVYPFLRGNYLQISQLSDPKIIKWVQGFHGIKKKKKSRHADCIVDNDDVEGCKLYSL